MNTGNLSWSTGYYKQPNGEVVEVSLHGIDLRDAVKRFPEQYSYDKNFASAAPAKAEEKKPASQKA